LNKNWINLISLLNKFFYKYINTCLINTRLYFNRRFNMLVVVFDKKLSFFVLLKNYINSSLFKLNCFGKKLLMMESFISFGDKVKVICEILRISCNKWNNFAIVNNVSINFMISTLINVELIFIGRCLICFSHFYWFDKA
jgi:hypothetical protein